MSLEPIDILSAKAELSELMSRVNRHYELHEYTEMVALYTEDAHYANWRGDVCGRAAILQLMRDREPDRLVRHVLSNTVIDLLNRDSAQGLCYVTAYINHHGHPVTRAVAQVGPPAFAEYHFAFRRVDGRWLISRKRTVEIFSGQVLQHAEDGGPLHTLFIQP
ncbi:nuclear transport factor 2 family protein [Variovorax terrae]|uniref:Nuclear transport factor 2 family protein n=1 Tax=Variovorax terrae TaxID=2923278 RepID=A0A9X1VXZ1_9BURK|nr:nuclear transport factor 2 family protein [Variovorax terrae]MCJ0765507.1 nuclear transport factor 2 family protein [Variovorax terrae]